MLKKALSWIITRSPRLRQTDVMCRFFKKKKEPKLLPKPYEVTCNCGKKYFEAYEPPKGYINVCDDCLPF